tara:strand:+ start:1621 stop:2271 length:651 start_codon:yes stop_codon:yes gene_type:complete
MVIMNKKNFIKIVQQPNNLSEKELKFVEEINKEYPYFQASKAILLKFLKKTEDIKFKKYLRSTAAYTKNREVLFDFINDINDQNEKVYFNKNEIKRVLNESPNPIKSQKIEFNSFVDWLELANIKPIDRENQSSKIDNFISKKPKLKISSQTEDISPNVNPEVISDTGFMTETLAKLYLSQKNYEKAIQSYKILSLKFPEKNSYFADQIKRIKKLK